MRVAYDTCLATMLTTYQNLIAHPDNPQWPHPALGFCSELLLNLAQQQLMASPMQRWTMFGHNVTTIFFGFTHTLHILHGPQYAHSALQWMWCDVKTQCQDELRRSLSGCVPEILTANMMLQISIARCQIEAEIHNIPMMYMIIFFCLAKKVYIFFMRILHNSSSLLLNLHCPHHNMCNGQIKHGPFLSSVALPILYLAALLSSRIWTPDRWVHKIPLLRWVSWESAG